MGSVGVACGALRLSAGRLMDSGGRGAHPVRCSGHFFSVVAAVCAEAVASDDEVPSTSAVMKMMHKD